MKINEVEKRVGISKKNIRFYEDRGLLNPARDKANGYREYSEEDVELLLKIKLLRRLMVPIEEIRKLLDGRLSLGECVERHGIYLNHERRNLELIDDLCRELAAAGSGFAELPAGEYLEKLNTLEKGGARFLNISKVDVRKKKRGARLSALAIIALVLLWDLVMIIASRADPMPLPVLLLVTVPPTVVIIGVIIALRERVKEIDKGEEDEAADY